MPPSIRLQRTPSILPATPPDIVRAMERLTRRPGVSGVYLRGSPARGDASIVVLVPQRDEKSLTRIGVTDQAGLPVDVREVGTLRAHMIDHGDALQARDATARQGTLTVVAVDHDRVRGLTAGHAALPLARAGHLTRAYPYDDGPDEVWLDALDASQPRESILVRGRFGGATDWALLTFSSPPADADIRHRAAQRDAPLKLRTTELAVGGTALHHSVTRNGPIVGEIDGFSPTPIRLRVDDTDEAYTEVVVVRGLEGDRFSLPGDSGSLVVDADRAAWGIVLGASERDDLAFVLTLPPLVDQLGADAPLFFTRST